jgi:hypothetical protein
VLSCPHLSDWRIQGIWKELSGQGISIGVLFNSR